MNAQAEEMKRIVEKEGVGLVAQEFTIEEMAKQLVNLSKEKIEEFKKNSGNASERYSSSVDKEKVRRIVSRLLEA